MIGRRCRDKSHLFRMRRLVSVAVIVVVSTVVASTGPTATALTGPSTASTTGPGVAALKSPKAPAPPKAQTSKFSVPPPPAQPKAQTSKASNLTPPAPPVPRTQVPSRFLPPKAPVAAPERLNRTAPAMPRVNVTGVKDSKLVKPVHARKTVVARGKAVQPLLLAGAPATTITTGVVTTLATVVGSHDTALGGIVYVSDDRSVFAVDPNTGSVFDLMNPSGTSSYDCSSLDGSSGATSKLSGAGGITSDASWLYVADYCGLRRINPATGATVTVSGLGSTGAYASGVAAGADGYIYVLRGSQVLQVDPITGDYSDFAHLPSGDSGYGLTADADALYINDSSASEHRIARVSLADGSVSTLVSDPALGFGNLQSIGDYIYAGAWGTSAQHVGFLRRYSKANDSWVNVAGSGYYGQVDGTGSDAWFGDISDVAGDGTNLYVVDGHLRKVTAGSALPVVQPAWARTAAAVTVGSVTTITGAAPGAAAVVSGGYIYVDDAGHSIQKIDLATGESSDLVDPTHVYYGGCVWEGASGATAQLNNVGHLATDGHYLYVADGCGLTRVSLATGATARFALRGYAPTGVTVGPDGNIYATVGQQVFKIDPVSGVAGPFADFGSGHIEYGLTSDADSLYVSDYYVVSGEHRIARVSLADGSVSTLVSDPALGFGNLQSIGDYIYLGGYEPSLQADSILRAVNKSNATIYDIAGLDFYNWGPNHTISGPPITGHVDGTSSDSLFTNIEDVTSDGTSLYAVDAGRLRKIGSSSSVSFGPADDHPSYFYNLDDSGGNGTAAVDSSGNHQDGKYTDVGNAFREAGPGGSSDAALFSSPDGGVVAPGEELPTGDSARTVEAWVKTHRDNEDIAGWGGTSGATQFVMAVRGDHLVAVTPDGEVSLKAPYPINNSEWHYVAVTYADHVVTGYVDGTAIGSGKIAGSLNTSASSLYIGQVAVGGDAAFGGYMNRVGVYARALNAGDIRAHFISVHSAPDYQQTAAGDTTAVSLTGNAYADLFFLLWFQAWNQLHATAVFSAATSASEIYPGATIQADLWGLRDKLDPPGPADPLTTGPLTLNSGKLRPDLVLTQGATKVVYEVQSVGQAAKCPAQIATYAAAIPATPGAALPTESDVPTVTGLNLTVYSSGDPGCVLYAVDGGTDAVYVYVYEKLGLVREAELNQDSVEERTTSDGRWEILVNGKVVAYEVNVPVYVPVVIPIP
jgi:hypothetical protein